MRFMRRTYAHDFQVSNINIFKGISTQSSQRLKQSMYKGPLKWGWKLLRSTTPESK